MLKLPDVAELRENSARARPDEIPFQADAVCALPERVEAVRMCLDVVRYQADAEWVRPGAVRVRAHRPPHGGLDVEPDV